MSARLPASPRALLRRSHFERQMEAELAFHIDACAADLERRGTPRDDALRHARQLFGRMDDVKDRCRQATGLVVWDLTLRALDDAWRMMRRQPLISLTIVMTLALCIGANAAVFSLVDAVVFRPLPYAAPERLARIELEEALSGRIHPNQQGATWEALRDGTKALDVAALIQGTHDVNYAAPGQPEVITRQRLSAGIFELLGVTPLLGRGFTRAEDTSGGPAAVILSHAFWSRAFGARRDLLGQEIVLRGSPHRIVGVMPAGFGLGATPDVWTPLRAVRTGEGTGNNYSVIGRLRPGVTWAQAEADVQRAASGSLSAYEPLDVDVRLRLAPLHRSLVSGARELLFPVWGAAALVLFIGCVNVAGLMLARGGRMRREIATRMALGCGRLGVVRQMLIESLALALCGGVAGLLVGQLAIYVLRPVVADALGVWQPIALDLRVLTMTLTATLATSVIFGLAPVLDACRVDIRSALSATPGRHDRTPGMQLPRRAVVVAEVALTVVLLVAAGLVVRTFLYLHGQDAGFDPRGLLTASVSLEDARYASRERLDGLFAQSLARIRSLPGVETAAIGLRLPYQRGFSTALTHVDGRAVEHGGLITNLTYVTPEYFAALRLPRRHGRTFDARDRGDSTPVAVVNEAFVAHYLSGRRPVGTRLDLYLAGSIDVVGVVETVTQSPLRIGGRPTQYVPVVYLPATQMPAQLYALAHAAYSASVVVRASATSASSTAAQVADTSSGIRRAFQAVDPGLPIGRVRAIDDLKASAYGRVRAVAAALSAFAALALLLAAIGIYGIVAHGVVERRRDYSIMAAIGATRWQAVHAAASPGLRLASLGILLGCVLGWLTGRLLQPLVVGVTVADTTTIGSVAGMLLIVAVTASLLPALSVARLDPADTLRAE